MIPQFRSISEPFADCKKRTAGVLVIGTGYGGSVAASRMARAGQDVVVLERGREVLPGDFPRDPQAAADDFQVTLSRTGKKLNDRTDCLFDMRVNDDVNVLVGSGLGGTSLINANVAIEPDARVYKTWPKEFKRSKGAILNDHFDRARQMLGSNPYPKGKTPQKLKALETIADHLDAPLKRPDINVTFKDGFNHAGLRQAACTDCGDCVTGCNYGAKNTTLMNYLPDAEAHGAKLFTGAEVLSISQSGKAWSVKVRYYVESDDKPKTRSIKAETVVLAAGTLGTNEILLRSRSDELAFSNKLGTNFSGNGDMWALGYNANIPDGDARAPIYGVGAGHHQVTFGKSEGDEKYKPGPCITGMVDLRSDTDPLSKGVLIEEGVMPGAFAPGYAAGFPMLNALMGDLFRYGDVDQRQQDVTDMAAFLSEEPLQFVEHVVYEGTVSRTMPFLVMGHDTSNGTLELENDTVVVKWVGAGREDGIAYNTGLLRKACDAIQAEFMPMPFAQPAMNDRTMVVHPLGGCAMADTIKKGVINYKCQVFDPNGDVHDGLYVCDGAAIPRGLGANPHLTITAVAEFAMAELAADKGWMINLSPGKPQKPPTQSPPVPVDPVKVLEAAVLGIRAIKTAIDVKAYELAEQLLWGVRRQINDLTGSDNKRLWGKICKRENLEPVIAPILEQVLDIFEPIVDAVKQGNALEAVRIAEEKLGDFSPELIFSERMTGRISSVGLTDPEGAFDPYATAAVGEANCQFTGDITFASARAALERTSPAVISNGVLTIDDKDYLVEGGEFEIFVPNEDKIECWEMHYRCKPVRPNEKKASHSFTGFKTLQQREGSHWWNDINDLSVDLKKNGKLIKRGMLRVGLESALDQANNLNVRYTGLEDEQDKALELLKEYLKKGVSTLPDLFARMDFRATLVKAAIFAMSKKYPELAADKKLAEMYKARWFARFAELILRTYGGVFSYMANFPALEHDFSQHWFVDAETYYPEVEPGVHVMLTRYRKADASKGPVILAGGFGTKASSFAMPTNEDSLAHMMYNEGYDVWLFDYRGSGAIDASRQPFTIDDVAKKDWPAAIDLVTALTGAESVQTIVHCVGSLSLFMAVLAGEDRVSSIISSQLGPHPIGDWLKYAQVDTPLVNWIRDGLPDQMVKMLEGAGLDEGLIDLAKTGLDCVDPRAPSQPAHALDPVFDGMLWDVPAFEPVPCKSPTCHRINFIFGPSFRHDQLNQATHNAIMDIFGAVSTTPFVHLGQMFKVGKVQSGDGSIDYLKHPERLSMPIHFIAGAKNQEILPESSLRTLNWLKKTNTHRGAGPYSRHVYPEYGHMDCFIGKNAHKKIFPDLIRVLEEQAHVKQPKKRKG